MIFGTVGDKQEHTGGGEPFDQAIQQSLSLAVDPVQVLGDQKDGLDLAFPDQQAFDGVQELLATLRGIEACHAASPTGTSSRVSTAGKVDARD